MNSRRFVVLLGPDGAGKSSVMAEVAARRPVWRTASVDDAFTEAEYGLIPRLRRAVTEDVLPRLGEGYSVEFLASLLQTAVVHLKDRLDRSDPGTPLLMDSYYYKILAKCRLAGMAENPMYAWWRSFPQPSAVVFLDVSPETAWRRAANGTRLNRLEYFGPTPEPSGFESYQASLRKLMLEEVRELPVTVIEEQPSAARAADAVLEVLADELA